MTAALRAWGLPRMLLLVAAMVVLIETTATDQLSVPPFSFALNGWSLVPPLVAITMVEPLVDRSPDLTEHATRSPLGIAAARMTLAGGSGAAVAGYCLLSPDGAIVAQYVLAAVSLAAVAVAAVGRWYWLPLLPLAFTWIQSTHGLFPRVAFAIPALILGTIVVGSCLIYLYSSVLRTAPPA